MSTIRRALTTAAVACLLALGACGTYNGPKAAPATEPVQTSVEIKDAVIVASSSGSARLTAKIVNHSDGPLELVSATADEQEAVVSLNNTTGSIPANAETSTGNINDPFSVRISDGAEPGIPMELALKFVRPDDPSDDLPPVTFTAPVVARSPANDDLLGVPSNAIKVKDAVIVVVPGQEKAYVGGSVVSTINDTAWTLPTAKNAQGEPVRYRHQTATGGPYGLTARKGRPLSFGGPPYRVPEAEQLGDADYFNAADVTVGETITVTIPFESGDVVASFKVIAE